MVSIVHKIEGGTHLGFVCDGAATATELYKMAQNQLFNNERFEILISLINVT